MSERQGLVGAMPVGERWRAQGHIGGVTKYLGTFDTEEEAHAVFVRARDEAEAARRAEAEKEVDRILAGPTFEYRGGVGRGAVHNGRKFKVVEVRGPHQALVVPVSADGVPDFTSQIQVTRAYLFEVEAPTNPAAVTVAPNDPRAEEEDEEELQHVPSDSFFDSIEPAVPKVAAGVSTSTPEALRKDIVRFAFRGARQDIFWAYEFAEQRARPKVASTFAAISGTAGFQRQLEWLRVNTTIPSDVIDAVERDYLAGLYVTPEMCREARAFAKEVPESCSVMFDDE